MKQLMQLMATAMLGLSFISVFAQTLDALPPASNAWKWTVGAGYQFSDVSYRTNTSPDSFKLSQNRVYIRAALGLGSRCDIGLHVGLGDASTGRLTPGLIESSGFQSVTLDTKANSAVYSGYAGLSFHGTLHAGKRFSFGLAGQGSIFSNLKATTRVVVTGVNGPVSITSTTDVTNTLEGFRDGQIVLSISAPVRRR